MRVTINQKKISLGSQYRISVNNRENYFAETDAFTRSIIHFYDKETGIEKHTIFKSLYLFRPLYKIEMPDGRRLKFKSKSFWGTYFTCIDDENIYELYFHPKRKISIYKNDIQIGVGQQNAITIFAGDKYELMLNENSDFELAICFFLILDNLNSRNGGNIFSINLGIVFKEFKKFNSTWKPK